MKTITSLSIKEITLDDRDFEGQNLRIPDNLIECLNLKVLNLRSYYEKNKQICIDFINNHPIIQQLTEVDFRFYDGMKLDNFKNVTSLSIGSDTLYPSSFPDLSNLLNLKKLSLRCSPKGSLIEFEIFCKKLGELPNLKEIRWSYYDYENLANFNYVKNVEKIEVSIFGNKRKMVLFDFAENLPKLKTLEVSSSDEISLVLPTDLSIFNNLRELTLTHCNLTNVDNYLLLTNSIPNVKIKMGQGFDNLISQMNLPYDEEAIFDLQGLNLNNVPEFIRNYKKIKSFKINGGKIDSSSFDKINPDYLEVFHADCGLSEIPSIVSKMTNLKDLQLGSFYGGTNEIREIPSWIGNLNNLERIAIVGNNLHSFPDTIINCQNIKNIYLGTYDGDYFHSNPICTNHYEIEKLKSQLPNAKIWYLRDQ